MSVKEFFMDAIRNGEQKLNIQKDKFAFSKTKRFSPPKIYNHEISYEPKLSDFDRITRSMPKKHAICGS